ncbi:VWA domain-containing protein [Streptomyces sp. NPDC086777]|uniref:VWA domain-containing protein n=1 Tax=Streptomyces sp. NPDC086777 TaxID=3154866 RepID=UPI00345075E2
MGILTLLRNAFGRSRKPRPAEAEGADQLPSQSKQQAPAPAAEASAAVPEPRPATSEEHDLVSAAFDNVTVPKQATRLIEPEVDLKPEPDTTPDPVIKVEAEVVLEPTTPTETLAPTPPAEETTPAPEPTSEPAAETTPDPAAETEPEPTPDPAAETEPEPTPDPAAETEPEPVAEAVTEPTSDPVAEATPEPAPDPVEAPAETAAPEPAAAADGESAPQGPPAPDDETVTGGAGGNTTAEGEAEATAPGDAATSALAKAGLTGTQAATYLVLDRSASMRGYYKDGSAAALADQTLALATRLTPDGETPSVHVVFFSTELDGTTDLTPASPENAIDEAHAGLGRMGRTSYHAAVESVLAHYDEHHGKAGTPALVVFQTDGAPDAKTPATQSLTDAAKSHPSVFFSFVAFGEHENKAFDYLRKLKTDNTAFFHAGPTPLELTDAELYDGLLIDWRP